MIRKATINDIFKIVNLENSVFSHTLGDKFLYDELTLNPFSHYFVDEINLEIVAYIGYRVIDDQADMMNFVVSKDLQGKGIGSKLLAYTLDYLMNLNVSTITLEVRRSNVVAQKIYHKFGFIQSHIRKNYYEHEDAICYIKEVTK